MTIERLRYDHPPEPLPPHNIQAEEAILGSALLDREVIARVAPIVSARDFYRERNGVIFAAMVDLIERESRIDSLTLVDELERTGQLALAGGETYLHGLIGAVPTPIHAEHYAKLVADAGVMRRLISVASKIAAIGYQHQLDPMTALERCDQLLADVGSSAGGGDLRDQVTLLRTVGEELSAIESGQRSATTGTLPTTFPQLDALLGGGFQRSDLVLLAGRPSIGKSSLMMALVAKMLGAYGGRAIIFSLEMRAEALVTRMLSSSSGVPLQQFRDGVYSPGYVEPLGRALGELALLDIWYDDGATQTVSSMKMKARRLAARGKLDLVVVDHIQLLDRLPGETMQQMLAAATRGLKALAKELNVVVLALSQLNRAVEQRAEKRPQLSDLRESGTLEQDADSVLMLWRNGEGDERQYLADLRVAKARNGQAGDVVLTWNPSTTGFGPLYDPRA